MKRIFEFAVYFGISLAGIACEGEPSAIPPSEGQPSQSCHGKAVAACKTDSPMQDRGEVYDFYRYRHGGSLESAPNSKGEVIYVLNSETNEPQLGMKNSNGSIIRLYAYAGATKVPVCPLPCAGILWLSETTFACVASGRWRSFYSIYDIERHAVADEAVRVTFLAEGKIGFKVRWAINGNRLIGFANGAPCFEFGL